MTDILSTYYLWIQSLHIIAVISWMAGMLYLPRLYVYHVENGQVGSMAKVFQTMERRLLRYIMNPAMIVVLITGGAMIVANPALMQGGWLHAKLTAVFLMIAAHGVFAMHRKQLMKATCQKSGRYFRIINEIPTVLMILIVILAVVKPF